MMWPATAGMTRKEVPSHRGSSSTCTGSGAGTPARATASWTRAWVVKS